MPSYNMNDYVPVAERVNEAKADIRSIHADTPVMLTDVMGYIRVTVLLQDERSATGTASFRLDLQGKSAQATNPIEDCETSAIGRALALLGYSSSKSIASREEVQEAARRASNGAGASYQRPANGANGEKASEKQIKMLFAIWNKGNYDGTLQQWIEESYHCKVDDLTKQQASAAIETLQPESK
jgi:hypothetical protein